MITSCMLLLMNIYYISHMSKRYYLDKEVVFTKTNKETVFHENFFTGFKTFLDDEDSNQ